jgi:hypothetical protein
VLIPFFDAYVVVTLADVELGKYDGSAKIMNEVSNEREGILITNRPGVNFPVVLYWS